MTILRDRASEVRNAVRYVKAAGLVFYLLAGQGILAAAVGVHVFLSGGGTQELLLPATGSLLAVCYGVVGYHLRRFRVWARNFAFAFALVGLAFFPVGTLLGVLILLCILRANRAGVFPPRRRAPEPSPAREEAAPVLRFDPELALSDLP